MPKIVGVRERVSMRYAEELVLSAGRQAEVSWNWYERGDTTFVLTDVEGALPDLGRLDEGYQMLMYTMLHLGLADREREDHSVGAHQITPRDPALHKHLLALEPLMRAMSPLRPEPKPGEGVQQPVAALDHRVLRRPLLIPPRHAGLRARARNTNTPALDGIRPVRWILSIGGVESRDVL